MTRRFSGKVALVTGGSRGIGAAIVMRLAEEGADVAFSFSASALKAESLVRAVEGFGVRAIAVNADQAVAEQVTAIVRSAHEGLGGLDILVNSAGVSINGVVGDLHRL